MTPDHVKVRTAAQRLWRGYIEARSDRWEMGTGLSDAAVDALGILAGRQVPDDPFAVSFDQWFEDEQE